MDTTGYDLADKVFKNIGKNPKHKISYEDMIKVISFWGFNYEAPRSTRIGFVCYCARERLKEIFEAALVYDKYSKFDRLVKYVEKKRSLLKEDNSKEEEK